MATMERKRTSAASTAEAVPAAGLDDRLSALLGGAPDEDDLPPMEAPQSAPAAAVAEPVQVAPIPTPAVVEVVAPPPAPVVVEAAVAPAPAPAPVMLVPRPMTNLTPAEKRDASLQAELYSILVTMEHLESAFVKGIVPNEEYERHCAQISTQFKTLQSALRDKVPDIKAWVREQGMDLPLSEERLLGTGLAATALHGTVGSDTRSDGKAALAIHSATEQFITLTNALQINYTSCMELLPLIQELQTSIVGIPNLPQISGLERITGWLVTLNNMRAVDTLNDDQIKQLTLDVELAYTAFTNWLRQQR